MCRLLSPCPRLLILWSFAALGISPLAQGQKNPAEPRLRADISVLASDEFEGRAPGSAGEEKSLTYIVEGFKKAGALPGNPDGTYLQSVPLVGITSHVTLTLTAGAQMFRPVPINDFVANSRRQLPHQEFTGSELVFVGYGVVAPEYGWDDYKGVDVRGKTVVMLINDPPVPDPHDPSKLDDRVFKGRAMTYYGRWTYKYEIASAKGATGCLIVHETGPAGYPFAVVTNSWGREGFDLESANGNAGRVALEGWISHEFAQQLFAAAGENYGTLKAAAARRDFHPVSLRGAASFVVDNQIRRVLSHNVVARIEGRDPSLKSEYVVHTAHWDHLGRRGDQIFHGAADNGSGVAVLLELARRYAALAGEQKPRRSILLLSVTAEEEGLLGSAYYAAHPLYPLSKTVAALNTDMANHYARTQDLEIVGSGSNTIEDAARDVAGRLGRSIVPDSTPEKGSYFRSDHFSFAKAGVPALDFKPGSRAPGKPADFMSKASRDFTENRYHKPADVITADWDFSAIAHDLDFVFALECELANRDSTPEWKPGSEFKAIREAQLRR